MTVEKQNKIIYYFKAFFLNRIPVKGYEYTSKKLMQKLSPYHLKHISQRVNYYNKLKEDSYPLANGTKINSLLHPKTPKSYYFDTYQYARFFDKNAFIDFVFGDVAHIPPSPSIVKSRPISQNNENSVLLNLDKNRHFVFIKNDIPFLSKKNLLIGRCSIYQEHRYHFFEKYFSHPLCNLAQVNTSGGNTEWYRPKISIKNHLDYKFILSLQGNDVATNLKWIMSSNSIAVMPKPTIETWFMEGTLEGGKHYIEIKPDYSDLEEQLNFYISHPEKCLEILDNAHQHCKNFYNKDVEDLCGILVLNKYFEKTKNILP